MYTASYMYENAGAKTMKTAVIALAAVLAFSGAAFAKDSKQSTTAPQTSTTSKLFIDPQTTGSIPVSTQKQDVPASKRLGGGIDPSVLPNF
jgi:hypothetical protein